MENLMYYNNSNTEFKFSEIDNQKFAQAQHSDKVITKMMSIFRYIKKNKILKNKAMMINNNLKDCWTNYNKNKDKDAKISYKSFTDYIKYLIDIQLLVKIEGRYFYNPAPFKDNVCYKNVSEMLQNCNSENPNEPVDTSEFSVADEIYKIKIKNKKNKISKSDNTEIANASSVSSNNNLDFSSSIDSKEVTNTYKKQPISLEEKLNILDGVVAEFGIKKSGNTKSLYQDLVEVVSNDNFTVYPWAKYKAIRGIVLKKQKEHEEARKKFMAQKYTPASKAVNSKNTPKKSFSSQRDYSDKEYHDLENGLLGFKDTTTAGTNNFEAGKFSNFAPRNSESNCYDELENASITSLDKNYGETTEIPSDIQEIFEGNTPKNTSKTQEAISKLRGMFNKNKMARIERKQNECNAPTLTEIIETTTTTSTDLGIDNHSKQPEDIKAILSGCGLEKYEIMDVMNCLGDEENAMKAYKDLKAQGVADKDLHMELCCYESR